MVKSIFYENDFGWVLLKFKNIFFKNYFSNFKNISKETLTNWTSYKMISHYLEEFILIKKEREK